MPAPGQTLGIVGESGSGKSVSSMAVLGLHDEKRSRITGSIRVGGKEVIGAFSVYGEQARSFTNEEIGLLSSLADDVSHAIDSVSNEQRRKEAAKAADRAKLWDLPVVFRLLDAQAASLVCRAWLT